MSLKRRNWIACLLLLLAAVCWTRGRQMTHEIRTDTYVTTAVISYGSDTTEGWMQAGDMVASGDGQEAGSGSVHSGKRIGLLLCFAAAIAAGAAVFGLRQKQPLLGPDGAAILVGISGWISGISGKAAMPWYAAAFALFAVLLAVREVWGWLRAKGTLSWCMVQRLAGRCPLPQLTLLVLAGWILAALAAAICLLRIHWAPVCCFLAVSGFGFACLWRYGADLNHFRQQLEHYRQGLPIAAGDGAFAQTEAQLLAVQAQQEEAIRTAVTSERFKVELISNVSHDLRTPLTAILGYSELLQRESLSPEGQEQLRCLYQKAGYMRELVESLFELTKVSSGVIESKREEIDLVRLLEQTIGLFDDQLTGAGLVVRRHYAADAIPIVTDGARMHQVFANLLGNAMKYALAGTRIYLEVQERERSFLVRMVNTSSYEMDFEPEEILQRFARGDPSRSTQGSGLGLAIAQTYTQSVGGTFRVAVDGDQFSAIVELPKTERNL